MIWFERIEMIKAKLSLAALLSILLISCDPGDVCKPPFDVGGFGLSGVSNSGPIKAGKSFGIDIVIPPRLSRIC